MDHDPLVAVTDGKDGIYIAVHAQPGAKKPQLRGLHGEAIKIAISAAAQEGKANLAIIGAIAEGLGVAKSDVEITSGQTSRQKRLLVRGNQAELRRALQQWFESSCKG